MNLLEKLEKIKIRFDQVNSQLSEAANTNDFEKIKNLNRERLNLEEIIFAHEKYSTVIKNIEGNLEIINSSREAELIEMAEFELDELKSQKDILERIASNSKGKVLWMGDCDNTRLYSRVKQRAMVGRAFKKRKEFRRRKV